MDRATAPLRRVETMASSPTPLSRVGTSRCSLGVGEVRSDADAQLLAREPRSGDELGVTETPVVWTWAALPRNRLGQHITDRTAVYGPVCTVVWEGSGRKARPYPDPRVERGPTGPTGTRGL